MSNPLQAALTNERAKLRRQEDNHASTVALAELVGEDTRYAGKVVQQQEAIATTKANIEKLEKALKAKK